MLLDVPGALWKLDDIDKGRRTRAPDGLVRIVVGIDPAVSSHESSDETGIIVAGKNDRGHAYILEDLSGKYAPDAWARTAISAYHGWRADRIVAEVNQGGALVEATLRMVDPNVPYTAVRSAGGTGGRDHQASRPALHPWSRAGRDSPDAVGPPQSSHPRMAAALPNDPRRTPPPTAPRPRRHRYRQRRIE